MNESKGEAMNDKIKELLAVLDMSEDRQRDWVSSNVPLQYSSYPLADLAFRLNNGKIDSKTPIEHIIKSLIEKHKNNLENDHKQKCIFMHRQILGLKPKAAKGRCSSQQDLHIDNCRCCNGNSYIGRDFVLGEIMKKLINFLLNAWQVMGKIEEARKELKPLRVKYYELCNKEARGTDANDELRRMLAINKRKQDSIKYGLANSLLHCEGYGDNNR